VLGNRVFVNTLETNKVFAISIEADGKAGAITEVKLDHAINNPDGMRSFGNDAVLVNEGGGSGALSRIKLDGNSGQVSRLKEGFPDDPVATTVVGTTANVLEGQLGLLFGNPDPNARTKPFRATAVELGNP
jgi:hypothetical protein